MNADDDLLHNIREHLPTMGNRERRDALWPSGSHRGGGAPPASGEIGMDVDNLDRWVETHQPDPSLEYGHTWWNGIEFIRMLRDRHRLEAVDVPATYWMETPPHPRERLLMPVYRIRHGRLECYLKTDFSLGYWYLSVRTPEPLRHTYGLFDPAMDWRREPRWLSGFREEWRYPSVTESPLRFTCELECEFDVYMLIRLLIAMPGSRWTYEASLPPRVSSRLTPCGVSPSLRGPSACEDAPETCRLRQCEYLNNVVEQDHRCVECRVNPGLGYRTFSTAQRTIQGDKAMRMLRQGQIEGLAKGGVPAQHQVINQLFGVATSRALSTLLLTPHLVFATQLVDPRLSR